MSRLNNASIRDKLKFLISMSILLMLLIAGSILTVSTFLSNKQVLQNELNALTEVTSLAITPALIFDNRIDAQQILTTLKAHQNVIYAAVSKTSHQQPFAVHLRKGNWLIPENLIKNCNDKNSFNLRFMQVCKPLIYDQIEYGHIILVISLDNIYQRLLKEMGIALLGLMLAGLLIFWFLEKIAKKLSDPILELVAISENIKHSDDYQQRANIASTDEIGQLGTAFNDMLEQIDGRNKALKQQKDTLEEQVQTRTLDLQTKTNEAYQLADKAEAASKSKSEFLATMSHEIRTPMNGVLGMTELLVNTPLNDRQKRLADTVYRSAESLLGVINNILDFSKIESGKFQLTSNEFDIRHLLEETVEIIAHQAHAKNLELILNLPLQLAGTVLGDAERLRQVLINLLTNAIKFTEKGEIQLNVNWIEQHNADTQVNLLFEVFDTGPGIATEQQTFIFESFTQADGSITRRYGGTGLGLSISKKLVKMMGGQLELSSVLGEGSCFRFSLCLERRDQLTDQIQDIQRLKEFTTLIVDDNATHCKILSNQLSDWGIPNFCVSSGKEAINHLQDTKQPYQIALIDWYMPEMDGLTLAKILHNNPSLHSLSIVMLSSNSVSFDQNQSKNDGISHFLTKPIIQQNLLNCLLNVAGVSPTQSHNQIASIESDILTGTILLAEDNRINQEVGMAILRNIGCQVEVVNDGLEAVKASAHKQYDAILMDCHMPSIDGFEATKTIRKREKNVANNQHTPIIALTADVQKETASLCKAAGMDDYVSKPFSKKQLQIVLKKHLSCIHQQEQEEPAEKQIIQASTFDISKVDSKALDKLRELTSTNGENLLNVTIRLFLNSAAKELEALKFAYDNQDCKTLSREAHTFKSACANLGIRTLTDWAASIETRSNQGTIQGVDILLDAIKQDLPDIMTSLNKELNVSIAAPFKSQTENKQNKRILIVDDDINFRLITHSVLASALFLVDEASNSLQALEKIKQQKPDLILLDAIMNYMDGFETCRLIRETTGMADIPIIMSTGLGDIDSINQAFESGATDFIVKPINYPILVHRLNFMLRAGQNAAELRSSRLQLSEAQRIARLGYWVWDVNQNHFEISEQLADLCAIDLKIFDGTLEGFIALVEPEDREKVQEMILKLPYDETVQHIEYRLQTTQASPIFVDQEMVKVIKNGQPVITGTVQDISQRKETESKIHRLAYFDPLTGLASRTYYHERIKVLIESASHHNEKFAFLFLDLDGFKDINDSLGHDLGDQLLKVVAQRLQGVIRNVDFVARLGGDEFCMLISDIRNNEFVAEVARRCLQKINEPLFLNHQQIKPRVSIGIAIFPRDGENEIELLKAADTAMYAAKQAGKQRYVFYSQDMAMEATSRLEKEQMLHEAFEKKQFILHFQPQISMQTGRMVGVEALARWLHPEKGIILPNQFIPDIERLGLVLELGNWALKAACKQMMQWHKTGMPFIPIAINISALHFQDTSLIKTVKNILAETAIPAKYLELEVTESAMQAEGCLNTIEQLRELGIKIAIDDFGTGYSCLASLKKLPLDYLKIDKVFIDDIASNSHTSLLLNTIIGLANSLDYQLIAEGVETKEQASIINDLDCQIAQGFFYSKPLPSDKIPELFDVDFFA